MIAEELRSRTYAFALQVVKFSISLPRNPISDILGKQLLRSATSTAANYRAACCAQTKPTFIAKMSIVVEEADETVFWLELIRDAGLAKPGTVDNLLNEATQIMMIMSASRKTASR